MRQNVWSTANPKYPALVYDIPLVNLKTAANAFDWIRQFEEKSWCSEEDLGHLVRAIFAIITHQRFVGTLQFNIRAPAPQCPKSARVQRRGPRLPCSHPAASVVAGRSARLRAGRCAACPATGLQPAGRACSFVLASRTPSPYQSAGRCVQVATTKYRRVCGPACLAARCTPACTRVCAGPRALRALRAFGCNSGQLFAQTAACVEPCS